MFMGVNVKLPIRVRVDNEGDILLTRNCSAGKISKHIDVKYHFVRQYEEEGIIMVEFIRTLDNVEDIFTKNTSGEKFYENVNKFMMESLDE